MPEAVSTPNLVALSITSQKLDRSLLIFTYAFLPPPPTKIGLANSPNTIGLRTSIERALELQTDLYICVIDYTKAFDCVKNTRK